MVLMYGINAKRQGWWDEVTIIVWGATVDLVGENEKIQELIKEAQLEGVHITACKACADQLGASETQSLTNQSPRGLYVQSHSKRKKSYRYRVER